MGVDSGLYKVGGVRVYAPPLLTPKFSPAGPCATVPVLGRSFPEESYPSLANQPSSGAKQGDMSSKSGGVEQCPPPERQGSGSVAAPMASTHSNRLRNPSPAGGTLVLMASQGTQVSSSGPAQLMEPALQ